MAYDGKLLARAREKLEERRADNQAEHQRRISLIYSKIPQIQRLDDSMRQQMTELVRLTLSKAPDVKERIAAIQKRNLDMQAEKAELLVGHGYPMDYLEDIYSCKICKDTGVFNAQPCECVKRLYNAELTQEVGTLLKNNNESFEHFRFDYYSDQVTAPAIISPRETMKMVYDSCKKFAEVFPEVQTNLLLQGSTGLGKTFLSASIARVVAKKGYSVCYDSASSALEAFEKKKFAKDFAEAEKALEYVNRMLSCDLMILDDLGTELLTPMSVNGLYTLINSRLVNGKRMIISTNLSFEELRSKYSPQICSRIEGEFLHLPFMGSDIRLIKKHS